jgi:hypothetical protein
MTTVLLVLIAIAVPLFLVLTSIAPAGASLESESRSWRIAAKIGSVLAVDVHGVIRFRSRHFHQGAVVFEPVVGYGHIAHSADGRSTDSDSLPSIAFRSGGEPARRQLLRTRRRVLPRYVLFLDCVIC